MTSLYIPIVVPNRRAIEEQDAENEKYWKEHPIKHHQASKEEALAGAAVTLTGGTYLILLLFFYIKAKESKFWNVVFKVWMCLIVVPLILLVILSTYVH